MTEQPSVAPRAGAWAADWRLVLGLVVAASAAYVSWHLRRGWFPVDDGVLAHSAERVLHGELPHRDFDEVYTGGLAYLNAAAFRLFGTTLWAMRIPLVALFVCWVPAVFYLASRFVRPLAAAAVTVLAVVWSLPNYAAPMPSWYNLFFATFGLAALVHQLEVSRRRWLVVAGVCGGLSMLVKIIGLYYVAGVLLYLVFRAHAMSRERAGTGTTRAVEYSSFITGALAFFVVALVGLVRRQAHAPEIVHFVLPGALLAGLLVRDEWMLPAGPSRPRFVVLARLMAPFLLGVALPVLAFLVPYALSGALADVVRGVLILPTRRFGSASVGMLPLAAFLTLLLPGGVILIARVRSSRTIRIVPAVSVVLVLTLLVLASGPVSAIYRMIWDSARMLMPALVIAGVCTLAHSRARDAADPLLRSRTVLLLSVAALCSLVQFPFSVAIYFCYVAPLVLLSALALLQYAPQGTNAAAAILAAFYLAFGVARVNRGAQFGMGRFYLPAASIPFEQLPGDRAGLEVPRVTAAEYQAVLSLLHEHAQGGYTWASPDSPEMYFLANLRNPTRSLYEFFDEPVGHSQRILGALETHGVTAIVENAKPPFSAPLDPVLVAALAVRYPDAAGIGPYLVRWR